MVRIERCVGVAAVVLSAVGVFAGCGDDGGSSGGGSFANIQNSISAPSGTVDAASADEVAAEFEKIAASGTPAFGMREDQVAQTQNVDVPCGSSGSISVTGSGNESSGSGQFAFNNCCETAGCCMTGGGNMYFSSSGAAAEADADNFSYCAEYDVQYSCEGETASLDYAGCLGASGFVYSVEVNGESYAVTGYYSEGSGSLTITGENGTWTCTYDNGSGSCSGDGETFTF